RLHRPAIAFAPAEPGSAVLRGSARSIPGLHIRDLLVAVDAVHPGLILKFGGHAMAAGLSLPLAELPRFETSLHEQAGRLLDPAWLQAEVLSDGELQAHEFDRAHAEALRDGGPWGQGYAEPLFDGEFELLDWRVVGERHLKLELAHGGQRLNAIHFGGWTGDAPAPNLRIAYRLVPDDYRGGSAIQMVVEQLQTASVRG
ncbi:MAG: DHHA1 domain-containing protein, partial [Gammaproteobacteria bacterium]|nr:DHHA1 domain-containing protein [Gammaproteobacteria bacterium]